MELLALAHALYSAMWSNMWAPSVWTLVGIGLSHIHLKRHINKKVGDKDDGIQA